MSDYARQVRRLGLVWLLGFASLALAAGWWQVVAAPALQAHPANSRAATRRSLTQPGNLYASDGTTLILSALRENGAWKPAYPEPEVFCHLTGYNERSGLQWGLREPLRGEGRFANPLQALTQGRLRGCDVKLTIDAQAQRIATRAMRGHRGAVVALDPNDGAIRVMVSAPAYDPSTLSDPQNYEVFRTDPFSPELNRALQGLYTPGSVLKVLTDAIGLETGAAKVAEVHNCPGAKEVAGTLVRCPVAHGRVTLTQALALSCNITFAEVAAKVGPRVYRDYARRLRLLDDPSWGWLPLPGKSGRMANLLGHKGKQLLVHTAYGQGETMVTPLALARLTATIARGGAVPRPYLVQTILNTRGKPLLEARPEELGVAVSPTTCTQVAGMMSAAVEKGTARIMEIPGLEVAAKTGTAQKRQGRPDVWMFAFAPVGKPTVALAVVVEEGESGGETAGPIAREVMRALLGG